MTASICKCPSLQPRHNDYVHSIYKHMVNHFIECISVLQDTWEKYCESHLYASKIMRGVTGRLLTENPNICCVVIVLVLFYHSENKNANMLLLELQLSNARHFSFTSL